MNYHLFTGNSSIINPSVLDGVTWETVRRGYPGKLTFKVISDASILEGDPVRFHADGNNVFYGYVFSKKRGKDKIITVTAYDQLRYLKNKDTYIYANKQADELIRMIADDFGLQCGQLGSTGVNIERRIEDNKTLFDIIYSALDVTLMVKPTLYVLYDDFGKLTLKDASTMRVPILIDEETGQNYDYLTSIDGETYNKVKLTYENEETGKRDVYIAQDSGNINEWGVLQYFDTLKDGENGEAKADALLKLYNQKTRNLTVKDAFGDIRVRAGSSVGVRLTLDDITVNNFMMAEKVVHKFAKDLHTMDLTLRGGDFTA